MFRKPSFIGTRKSLVVGAYLSRKKKGGLYNAYHELLSEKWLVKRFWFHASYIISPQPVAIFVTFHLVDCIEYYYKSLEDKADKSAVATSYQVGWIDYALQNILGQKFRQNKMQNVKTLQWKSESEIHRPASSSEVHWKLISLNCLSPL